MKTRTPVYVHAVDSISRIGLSTQLHTHPELCLVDEPDGEPVPVGVVVADTVEDATLDLLRSLKRTGIRRSVLIVNKMDDISLLAAIDAGVCAIAHRAEATPALVAKLAVKAASGSPELPADLLARLLTQVSRLQNDVLAPMGVGLTGLSARETEVLRLVADGLDTNEIARELSYSDRTVKNILHAVTSRFHLRNRSHAVAYALREGYL